MREAIADGDSDWILGSFQRARGARRLFSSLADQGVHPVTDSHPSVFEITGAKKGLLGKYAFLETNLFLIVPSCWVHLLTA